VAVSVDRRVRDIEVVAYSYWRCTINFVEHEVELVIEC